jgi:hypothetical protein
MTTVVLSDGSKALIEKLEQHFPERTFSTKHSEVDRAELVNWLDQSFDCDKEHLLKLESLRAKLLKDLRQSNESKASIIIPTQPHTSWYKKAQFIWLAVAGTLLAICEGFDGMASMMGLLPAVSPVALFVGGLVFSAMSIAVFYGFDLVAISDNLGVSFNGVPKLLDVVLEQTREIKRLQKHIEATFHKVDSIEEIKSLKKLTTMLKNRLDALDKTRNEYNQALNEPKLKGLKVTAALFTGALFFSGGFFTGQAMAVTMAGIMGATASITAAPVIALSCLMGLAAFSIYWYLERPGFENLVGQWFGLDQNKIDEFAGIESVSKRYQQLEGLQQKIDERLDLISRRVMDRAMRKTRIEEVQNPVFGSNTQHSASNQTRYSLFKRSASESDLVSYSREAELKQMQLNI